MNLFIALAAWSELAFGLVLFASLMVANEVGYLLGRRHSTQGSVPTESVGVVVGGVLGLLAFVLALTLSFSSPRFNDRRDETLAEANAIGTAWLRAESMGEPRGIEIARLLERYTHLRIAFANAPEDRAMIDDLNRQTNALQTKIWGHVSAIERDRRAPIVAALMAALSNTFDMTMARRFAFEFRLPPQVFWLLIGMALLGMAVLGYQLALRNNPLRGLVVLLTLVWTVLIVDILDMGASGRHRAARDQGL
jgi:drug/metabolite transporter (DMT)-like permease